MAIITNVGDLKSALTNSYLFHSRLVSSYDIYLQNFETDANALLRVLPMEAVADLVTINGVASLPADYLAWRTVKNGTQPYLPEADYVHPAYLPPTVTIAGTQFTHPPVVFTIEGNNLVTRPVNDGITWQLHYYQKIPALAAAPPNTANWLLTEWPNVYLFGALTEAAAAQRNTEMAQLYKARRDEVFQEIVKRYAMTTGATSPAMRTAEYY